MDDPDRIRELEARVDGGVDVSGSGTPVRSLLRDGLVDELHLFVFPLTRRCPRLFDDSVPRLRLAVEEAER